MSRNNCFVTLNNSETGIVSVNIDILNGTKTSAQNFLKAKLYQEQEPEVLYDEGNFLINHLPAARAPL